MHDFIIVGAGIVGPALAKGLADRGFDVLILERDLNEPDRIVGELLQPGGVQALKRLQLEDALENIDATRIYGYEVIYQGHPVRIPYPELESTNIQAEGRGFHHGRFVMNLRRIADATERVTLKQATVSEIIEKYGRVVGVRTKELGDLPAKCVVVCDGTSSKFRKQFVSTPPVVESFFVGAVLDHPQLLAPNHGHVVIGSDFSPILVYQTSETEARILCDVPLKKLPSASNGDLKRWLEKHCLPHLPQKMQPLFAKALEGRLRSMPNQYLPAVECNTPGVILLGDALNMRHPLTGGGMTVGLRDANLLASLLANVESEQLLDDQLMSRLLAEFRRERKRSSVVVNVLSISLYRLFAAQSNELQILQRGCFRYFQRGGECVRGPCCLLSGLEPRPALLFYHFFAVAFYAVRLNYADKWATQGLLGILIALYQSFSTIWEAAVVFIPVLIKELW